MGNIVRKKVDSMPNQLKVLSAEGLPIINAEDYRKRLDTLYKAGGDKYTHYVIYANRECYSNMEYFTGIDPRFEEALLIVAKGAKPVIVVGDEGCDYAKRIPYPINITIYHAFSLPNQPRRTKTILADILKDAGLSSSSKVGVIGWKYFDEKDFNNNDIQFDLPLFIYNELVAVCGTENLDNATSIMIDNVTGLRNNLDAKEFLLSEYAGAKSSRATLAVLQNLKEGISELEASAYLAIDGDPLSVHPNINFAENYFYALASPSHAQKLKHGDMVGAGMAYRRTLCHKVGIYVNDESELEPKRREDAKFVFDTYFAAIKKWYETIGIGVTGGYVVDEVEKITGPTTDFGIGLNLGHTIHTDEWTNTPFYSGSTEKLHSGLALQCDFTSAFAEKNVGVHAEDGILIADEKLRTEMKVMSPEAYERIEARRDFMINVLGIKIKEEILPTSDMPAVVFPFLKDIATVIAYED